MQKNRVLTAAPLIRFLPAATWYALIFWFSSRDALSSGGQSSGLLGHLLNTVSPAYGASELQAFAVETLSFPVRKAAHMFLYFILALLLLYALSHLKREGWLVPVICGALAVLDEYHQTLVPGRSGEFRDMLVDLCGSVIALGLWTLVLRSRRRTVPVPAWLAPFLLLAAATLFPQWAEPVAAGLAERFTEGFSALDAAAQTQLLDGAAPIFRESMSGTACGLVGAWVWIAGRLSGAHAALGVLSGALVLTAGLLGILPPLTAALAVGAGWGLTAVLWGLILLLAGREEERKK